MSKLEQRVQDALTRAASVVLAVSGGVDSMVLLDVATRARRRAGCDIVVGTFDHASGPHSARAAAFVARSALEYGLPVVIGRDATNGRTEAAWRAARWGFLRSVARAAQAVVLTAHTRDDQVETVLMRLLRGAGARGLAGLMPSPEIGRPLLGISRGEIVAYARTRSIEWLEDPTNRTPRYLRNRVRRDLLPALRRVHPEIDAELLGIARRARAWRDELAISVDRYVGHVVGRDEHGVPTLDVAAEDLEGYSGPMAGIVWPELASRLGVTLDARGTRRAAQFTISSQSGGRIQLAGGWELMRSRNAFELRATGAGRRMTIGAEALEPPMTWDRWRFRDVGMAPMDDAWTASLPSGRPLRVRAWRPGDRLTVRHDGRLIARKVKYFLSDAGISGHIRPRWPVVVAGDEIVWIPGVRRSDAATARSGGPVVTYVCDYLDRRP